MTMTKIQFDIVAWSLKKITTLHLQSWPKVLGISHCIHVLVFYLKQTRFDAKLSYESSLFPPPFNYVEGEVMPKQLYWFNFQHSTGWAWQIKLTPVNVQFSQYFCPGLKGLYMYQNATQFSIQDGASYINSLG